MIFVAYRFDRINGERGIIIRLNLFSNASMIEKNNILILNFSRYITNLELTIITLRETEYFFPFFCRADLRLYAVLHRLEMEREREREDSCIKIGSILKNEKVMAHENSRGTEQGAIGCVVSG